MISRSAQLSESGRLARARNARNKRGYSWPVNCPYAMGIQRRDLRAVESPGRAMRLFESAARRVSQFRTWRVDETTINWDEVGGWSGVAGWAGGALRFRGGGAGSAGTRRYADVRATQSGAAWTHARASVDFPSRYGPARVRGGCPAPDGLNPRSFSEKPKTAAAAGRADEGLGQNPTEASAAPQILFFKYTGSKASGKLRFGPRLALRSIETRC
jgi:hypothetical protein